MRTLGWQNQIARVLVGDLIEDEIGIAPLEERHGPGGATHRLGAQPGQPARIVAAVAGERPENLDAGAAAAQVREHLLAVKAMSSRG